MLRSFLLGLVLILSFSASAVAQTAAAALRGITSVGVVIQELDPDAVRDEFTADLIRTDVELELRKAGIRVVSRDELDESSGRPYVYVFVSTAKGALNVYAYNIEMRLYQNATLTRNPDIGLSVPTWSRSVVGTERGNRLPLLRDKIKEMTGNFLNDYLSVNPR